MERKALSIITTLKKMIINKNIKLLITLVIAILGLYFISIIFIYGINRYIETIYANKIWIHRVNSKEKLIEVNNIFDKYELDVIFMLDNNSFDVNHPPAKSINLNLLDYFKSINVKNKNMFWLDFKNLTSENMQYSCDRIDYICEYLEIKHSQLIIESMNPKYLSIFKDKGYMTSYYLPPYLNKLQVNLIEEKVEEINQVIRHTNPDYISASYSDYFIIKRYIPKYKILTWSFDLNKFRLINPRLIILELKKSYLKYKILSDKDIKVALFKYSSKNGDR